MKTLKNTSAKLLIIVSIIASLASCDKWDLKGIKGEGAVVSQQIDVNEVEGIILEIPASVYITKGDEQSISINAQQNIIDNIERTIDGTSLKLGFDKNVSRSEPIKVYMTIAVLKAMDLRGAGEILTESEFEGAEVLDVSISGSGTIKGNVDATEVNINISGSGDVDLNTICTNIHANVSGSGDINLIGSAKTAGFNVSGSGDISAYDFPIETCIVSLVGSGGAKLNVSEKLSGSVIGSGDVWYKGTPAVSVSVTGSGEIHNVD